MASRVPCVSRRTYVVRARSVLLLPPAEAGDTTTTSMRVERIDLEVPSLRSRTDRGEGGRQRTEDQPNKVQAMRTTPTPWDGSQQEEDDELPHCILAAAAAAAAQSAS